MSYYITDQIACYYNSVKFDITVHVLINIMLTVI